MTIEETTFPGGVYLGIRTTVPIKRAQEQDFYATVFQKLGAYCAQHGIAMHSAPVSICYAWDEKNGVTDIAPAFPVEGVEGVYENSDGIVRLELEGGNALKAEHYGSYEKLKDTHTALLAYCREHAITPAPPFIEEYVTDPGGEEDQAKWLTNVYYTLAK